MAPDLPVILLAAGRGERLRPLTDDRPKAMVEVAGEPLATRALRHLASAGLDRVVAVTGWRADAMEDLPCEALYNERWDTDNNVVSLWAARDLVAEGCFVVNCDVIFQQQVAMRLAGLTGTRLLVDGSRELDAEAMKAEVVQGRLRRLSKRSAAESSAGEYIGLLRVDPADGPRLAEILAEFVASGRTSVYYEDAIEALGHERSVRAERIDGLAWAEIDDHADLAHAKQLFVREPA